MSCGTFEEKISVYLDHELSDGEAEGLFTHLGTCSSCRKVMSDLLALRSGMQEEVPLLAPRELDEKVMSRTRKQRARMMDREPVPAGLWRRRIAMRVPVVAVAASIVLVVALVVSSIWLGINQQSGNAKTQTLYLTAMPTVEVRAYEMEPVTVNQ